MQDVLTCVKHTNWDLLGGLRSGCLCLLAQHVVCGLGDTLEEVGRLSALLHSDGEGALQDVFGARKVGHGKLEGCLESLLIINQVGEDLVQDIAAGSSAHALGGVNGALHDVAAGQILLAEGGLDDLLENVDRSSLRLHRRIEGNSQVRKEVKAILHAVYLVSVLIELRRLERESSLLILELLRELSELIDILGVLLEQVLLGSELLSKLRKVRHGEETMGGWIGGEVSIRADVER